MRLNKILFLLLTSAVLVSCSNDDDSEPMPGTKTKLYIAVQAKTTQTKAIDDPNALPGEININRLTALVFNETGSQRIGYKTQVVSTTDGTGEIEEIETLQEKAQIVVIANAPENAFDNVQTLEECRATLADLQSQTRTSLTMSTRVIASEEPLVAEGNYIGYDDKTNINNISEPVLLTRIAARIDVKSIGVAFTTDRLKGRTVRIDGIYLANAKSASRFFSIGEWGGVEASGHLVYGAGAEVAGNVFAEEATPVNYLSVIPAEEIEDGTKISDVTSFYTFENLSGTSPTAIVLKATLLAKDSAPEEVKFFSAVINPNGTALHLDHNYIRRNYVYNLDITFSDASFNGQDPYPATFDMIIRVACWNSVVQDIVVS